MQEQNDSELLERYAEGNSEEAFAELVARYVNLVFSTALRHVGNPQHAEEITQAVFIILARKARSLRGRSILSGWLYHTARMTAANFARAEKRRLRREQEAYMQSVLNEPEPGVWMQIAPMLDGAMAGLSGKDREAIVLRFFDGRKLSEVGATLGTGEEAARKRVNAAVEKLRGYFTRRGVVLSAAVLTAAIGANSVHAAPAGLAVASVTAAAGKGMAAGGSTLALIKATLNQMAWAKAKTIIVIGGAVILAAGTTTTLVAQHHQPGYAAGTNAVIPYKTMDDVCQMAASVDSTKILAQVTVSARRTVHPADISLTIQSATKGPIAVQIGTNGEVLNFPHEKELRRENPPIIANQPKGTVGLSISAQLPIPEDLTFRYHRLGDWATEPGKIIKTQAGILSRLGLSPRSAPKPQGVIFFFPKTSAGKAKVEIAAASGRKEYTADRSGRIILKLEKTLLAEDPEVTLSEKPQQILPDMK
jgi:RNA polymerase sigma factor (sigma-70 family)